MNTLRNSVKLIGRLGIDPEVKTFGDNKTLARFRMATHEVYTNKSGERVEDTTWHTVVVWGKKAELCKELLSKGDEVAIEGKLVNNSYETKDGEKRFGTEISLREFILMGDRQKKQVSN